jgi:hypothetical protein
LKSKEKIIDLKKMNKNKMDCWKMKMSIYFHKISLKIPLLRHWSIWESMYYSTYLAPRLGIWKENEAGKI